MAYYVIEFDKYR